MRIGKEAILSGTIDLTDPNKREDAKKFEAIMRHALGRLAARRLASATSVSINGHSVPRLRDAATGRYFAKLDSWAAANGWSYRWNPDTAMIALSKGSRTAVVPLGARKIKVDGTWRDTGEVVLEKSGVYVNLASLP